MQPQEQQMLHDLATHIERRRLRAPVRLALEACAPISFIMSQVALLAQPLVPNQRWRGYLTALTHESGWDTLYRILDSQEC